MLYVLKFFYIVDGYRSVIDIFYNLVTKPHGKRYTKIREYKIHTSFDDVQLYFDNLFPGNPDISKFFLEILL